MKVIASDEQQLLDRVWSVFGPDLTNPAAAVEALRYELSARLLASGRSLCERVQNVLQPLATFDVVRVRELLGILAASGDITAGPGGMFSAAPLRLVQLGTGRYAVHTTLPTAQLRKVLPCEDLERGISRIASVAADQELTFAAAVGRIGGLVLSPQRWAGMDHVPAAGPEWLEELNHRLEQDQQLAGSLDVGLVTPWQVYRPDVGGSQRQRWRSAAGEGAEPRLWRARHEYGWWRFAWTEGDSPSSSPLTRLVQDDARRTQFALDRKANTSLAATVVTSQDHVDMQVDAYLPRAEYRYLTTLGKRVEADGPPRYLVPNVAWEQVAMTLRARLGITHAEGRPS